MANSTTTPLGTEAIVDGPAGDETAHPDIEAARALLTEAANA